jgi:hypothetical protein
MVLHQAVAQRKGLYVTDRVRGTVWVTDPKVALIVREYCPGGVPLEGAGLGAGDEPEVEEDWPLAVVVAPVAPQPVRLSASTSRMHAQAVAASGKLRSLENLLSRAGRTKYNRANSTTAAIAPMR